MKLRTYYNEYYMPARQNLSPSTLTGYESDYRCHIDEEFGEWEIHEIRVRDINAWVAKINHPGAAASAYKVLRQLIRSAIADEIYPEEITDPTRRTIRLPKIPYYEPPVLNPQQIKALLKALYGHEYEPVVVCEIWLGLRRCEACGLQWGDIDLKTGIVRISRGMQYVKGSVVVTAVKTHRSNRPNMLPRSAVNRLREIKRDLHAGSSDWLLGENDPNPDKYARRLKAFCKKQGVACVAPKNFRHTFACNSHRAGVKDGDIQKMLGHKDFSTTFRNYMQLDEDMLRTDQKLLEKLILKA